MNARKFIAASSREALQLVRAELGAEAVILSNRKVQDGVEIVAMAGSELAHLNETRMQVQHAEQTRSAPRPRAAAPCPGAPWIRPRRWGQKCSRQRRRG